MQRRYEEYQQLCTYTSNTDRRSFQETLREAIEKVGKFGTAFHMYDDGQLRGEILVLLNDLSSQYLADGDIAAFESDYLQRAKDLLAKYQLSQISLVEKKATRAVNLLPPVDGLDDLKILLQTHYMYVQSLNKEFELSRKVIQAYSAWKASVRGIFRAPEDEFCLQTAYIHFARLFFVRVCEDHALIVRRISDGPFSEYEEYRHKLLSGIKDAYQRLLEEAYQRASSVYHNFFGHHQFYDWFVLDEYNILALFDLLNHYDFHGLSADVLGRVYNEGYIEAKERSERGQFYTPPQVVDYMLDAVGIPAKDEADERKARAFLEKKVGDLSCGSGTFLVAAAARKSALLQRLVATDEITPDHALQQLTETFLGFDLNPFACYLQRLTC
ncbi:MAG: N-6 DNA methylase [Ktedonobacteraceae bacterium]|nr:N-6 DNA methylase [Ktedonobacteraceae bacterium]